jgi:hypothetical protein
VLRRREKDGGPNKGRLLRDNIYEGRYEAFDLSREAFVYGLRDGQLLEDRKRIKGKVNPVVEMTLWALLRGCNNIDFSRLESNLFQHI